MGGVVEGDGLMERSAVEMGIGRMGMTGGGGVSGGFGKV